MSIENVFLRPPKAFELFEESARRGMFLEFGSDFNTFRDILRDERSTQVGPPFDPELHELSEENAFWIIGRTAEGKIAHTQAIRLFQLGKRRLGDWLTECFRDFPPVGLDLDMAASGFRAGPGSRRMSGRVCYHGEMWLDANAGEFRGKGVSALMTRVGFLAALNHFAPDHIFAFMAAPVAFKGLPQRAGFLHTEPASLSWKLAQKDVALQGFMAYNSREDMRYLLRLPMDIVA